MGSADRMRRTAEIMRREEARITVLSAMAGTTDLLVRVSETGTAGGDIAPFMEALREKYAACIDDLLTVRRKEALGKLEEALGRVVSEAERNGPAAEKKILSEGELLTSAIFALYLEEAGLPVRLLHAPAFLRTDAEGRVDTAVLRRELNRLVRSEAPGTFFITQGFICTGADGNISNLGRGGSDYSAALLGAAADADEVQIWTDIDGMHNNDPRYVEGTVPIRRLGFDEAAELAYFGAKILHPSAVQPCREAGIGVRLKNTLDPEAEGTLICDGEGEERTFRAVAAKDGITLVRIRSARMLMAYGFLRRVFGVFEKYRTPIDMIATSEVAVSLTVDRAECLDRIVEELRELGEIEVERNNAIVCVVGHLDRDRNGVTARVLDAFRGTPVKMISYGASHRSMVVLVDAGHKIQVLRQLNERLFRTAENDETNP